MSMAQPERGLSRGYASPRARSGGQQTANLGDVLERVLDKGLVIAGDIQVNLLDIELLTIKLRLVIASLDTAREVGIDWWETDPWLNSRASRDQVARENRELRQRVSELESVSNRPAHAERGELADGKHDGLPRSCKKGWHGTAEGGAPCRTPDTIACGYIAWLRPDQRYRTRSRGWQASRSRTCRQRASRPT